MKRLIRIIKDPRFRLEQLSRLGFFRHMSDEDYIKKYWKAFYHEELSLCNPQSLCEKLQWLKLFDRKPEYIAMVDKYEAKRIVAQKIGQEYIIPTIGVWDNPEDIDIRDLPNQFVLKPTHDSGGLIVCRDKSQFNMDKARKMLRKSLKYNYYWHAREWPYKHVKPRIIAEPLMEELGKEDSIEYKTTCFNGKAVFVTICTGIAHTQIQKRMNDHFDTEFNKLPWYVNYLPAKKTPEKPPEWDEIIRFSEKLAENVPYLRVDTYILNRRIVFGEMTFYTWGGFMHFEPKEWDYKLGAMLQLPAEMHIMD